MNKIKKWIKKKLQNFLGITILDDEVASFYRQYHKNNSSFNSKLRELEYQNAKLRELNDFLISQFNVSADLGNPNHHDNWAVLSIKGNPEYVKFVDLRGRDLREIIDYLKRFEGTNRVIDSPFHIRGLFN